MLWNRHLVSMATWQLAAWVMAWAWGCQTDPGMPPGSTHPRAGGGGHALLASLSTSATSCIKGAWGETHLASHPPHGEGAAVASRIARQLASARSSYCCSIIQELAWGMFSVHLIIPEPFQTTWSPKPPAQPWEPQSR